MFRCFLILTYLLSGIVQGRGSNFETWTLKLQANTVTLNLLTSLLCTGCGGSSLKIPLLCTWAVVQLYQRIAFMLWAKISFAFASSFLVKTGHDYYCLLPSCLLGFKFPICVVLLHCICWGDFLLGVLQKGNSLKVTPSPVQSWCSCTDFSIPLLSQSWTFIVVVLSPTLRARLQHLCERDKSSGAEPVRVTAETLFPVLDLHRLRQPGRERRRVPRCSVWRRGSSSGHCPCCCNWEEGCFRWQWWKWLSNYLNLKTISFKNDFWMNEQVNEELACVTIC